MGKLLPGEKIIYERVNDTIYARYQSRPDIPRWVVGSYQQPRITHADWVMMTELCRTNPTFKKEFDKLVDLYHLLKEE